LKRVLITGANSYVGTSVENGLKKEPEKYYIESLDMKDPNWKNFDFSKFDIVFHVAGIAHVSTKKSMKEIYFKVNRDLTIETAIKAKKSGVKQFIFMSSMIVYNSKETKITLDTNPDPDNFYGLSKLQAENGIKSLQSDSFNVCILRPPMIYGPYSKGNFIRLVNLSKKLFLFPRFNNVRSFLYINNLVEYIKLYIDHDFKGVYFPQNSEYFCTSELYGIVRKFYNKKVYYINIFNFFIHLFRNKSSTLRKVFGDHFYSISNSIPANLISFDKSMVETLSTTTEKDSKI